MSKSLTDDLDQILGTMAKLFAAAGSTRELAILTVGRPSIEETGYDNWNGGTTIYTIFLQLPAELYAQVRDDREALQRQLLESATDLLRLYPDCWLNFEIAPEVTVDERWRERSLAWLTGRGVTNQGRVRSDNVASRTCDGLLFRSQPEINLYLALKSLGVSFAPLPVFIRGGETYRRIEPDFVILKDGVLMIVEVDGDVIHQESPVEAHNRTTMLAHEGALVERVKADDCNSVQGARECATRLLAVLAKMKFIR